MSDEASYFFLNVRSAVSTWIYNANTTIGSLFVRLIRFAPRCECGWRLARRFDGLYFCGHCEANHRAVEKVRIR